MNLSDRFLVEFSVRVLLCFGPSALPVTTRATLFERAKQVLVTAPRFKFIPGVQEVSRFEVCDRAHIIAPSQITLANLIVSNAVMALPFQRLSIPTDRVSVIALRVIDVRQAPVNRDFGRRQRLAGPHLRARLRQPAPEHKHVRIKRVAQLIIRVRPDGPQAARLSPREIPVVKAGDGFGAIRRGRARSQCIQFPRDPAQLLSLNSTQTIVTTGRPKASEA